jgi:hypothetical protein
MQSFYKFFYGKETIEYENKKENKEISFGGKETS